MEKTDNEQVKKEIYNTQFPDGLVVRIWHFHCRGLGSIPGQGTEIPQAMRMAKKKEKKRNI